MDQVVIAKFALATLALCAASSAAMGQVLTDPTQPPAGLIQGVPSVDAAPAASTAPRVQSILISTGSNARRIAVIDGVTVRVGDKFRDTVVLSMSGNEVVLQRGRERQVLTLNPVLDRKAAPAARPGAVQQ